MGNFLSSNNALSFNNKDFMKIIRDAAVLSDASYQEPVNTKTYITNHYHYHNICKLTQTQNMTEDGLSYILAKSASGTLYVAIRGTVNFDDWKKINFQLGFDVSIEGRSGRVHKGFWNHANKLPLSYLQEVANNGTQVVFTGHSLGGATAAVAAMILMGRVHDKERVICVTFGAPLFADESIQQGLESRGEEDLFFHFVAEKDIVPRALNAPTLAKRIVQTLFSKGGNVFQDFALGTIPYVPIGHFKVFGEEDYNLEEAKEFMGTRVPLTTQRQTYVEGLQQHSIGFYLGEMKKDWANLSFRGCHIIKDIDTIPKVGLIDIRNDGAKTLHIQIFGLNLMFIESLEARDLSILSDKNNALVEVIGITKLNHTSDRMEYDIKMSRKVVINRYHKASLTVSFQSRFKNLSPERLDIHASYFPSRKQRIKHEAITETLIQIRHRLIADIKEKTSNRSFIVNWLNKSRMVKEMIEPHNNHLEDLDNWLNSAIDGDHLGENQKSLLRAVITSVENTNMAPEPTFKIICDTADALNKNDKEKIKLCCSKLHFGERSLSEQEKEMDFFESSPPLPRDFFKNTVIGGLEDQNDEVSLQQSQLVKMGIMLAVGFGIVVKKLFQHSDFWGKISSLLQDQSFQTTSCFENHMIRLVEEVVGIEDSQDLYSKEKKIGNLDITNYRVNYKPLLSLVKPYCSKATKLRDTVLNTFSFNIGFVGQPGTGKSTITSKEDGIFQNAPAFNDKTSVPRHIRCSDHVNCIDFPGMYGTDEFPGADPNVFRRALHTLDAVAIFVKAYDRSYKGASELVKMVHDVPIYVCMTHVDKAIKDIMDEIEQHEHDQSNEGIDCDESDDEADERRYKEALQKLNRWRSDFCIRHKVNAHFVIPSKFLLEDTRKEKKRPKKDIESKNRANIKGVEHLVDWLFEMAKCSGVDMNPALQSKFCKPQREI